MESPAKLTMKEARQAYFEENAFGADGGYHDPWVDFKLGPIPFPFPNTPMRVRAVRYHDLHHLITGYPTDLPGELEIAAWEIGAGCRDFIVAWQLNLGGMASGMLFMPRRVMRAFVRGRRSQSLYGRELEPLLDMSVDEVRTLVGLPTEPPRANAADYLLLAMAFKVGLVIAAMSLVIGLVTLPLAYLAFAKRARLARMKGSRSSS